jgi:hypothetical protein
MKLIKYIFLTILILVGLNAIFGKEEEEKQG